MELILIFASIMIIRAIVKDVSRNDRDIANTNSKCAKTKRNDDNLPPPRTW